MKKVFLSVFFCGAAFAQLQDIPGTEAIGVSRQKIVDNFNYLNTGKASATIGSVLPSNCSYNSAGPILLFINNTGPTLHVCVAGDTWTQLIGGGNSGQSAWGQIVGTLMDQADLVAALTQKAALVHGHAQSEITGLVTVLTAKEATANKGQPNGYAPLDAGGKVPSTNLPASSAASWGAITGNIGDQPDLGAALSGKEPANANIQQHISSTSNPHSTTKAQVGLGNVTNDAQLKIASNLGDLGNVPSARTNLGLGGAAILNLGAIAGTVAAGDHLHDARYSQTGHGHGAGDITSGLFAPARLGSGAADSTVVLYGDNVWRTPPGSSGGEANTASNQGSVGVGVFKSKLGVDLGFYNLNPASQRISIGITAGDHIDLDVVEGQIGHQNLSGAGTNTHAQIDTHLAATNNPHGTTCDQAGAPCTASTYNNPAWLTGLAWSKLSSVPSTFTPSAHAASHGSGQSDAITIAESQVTNLATDLGARVPATRQVNGHALSADVTISKSDVGLGSVPNTDTTNAANISSGTLPAARLPSPGASSKGGVYSIACGAGQHLSAISSTDGSVSCSADTGGHTPNTDTGTTSAAFLLDSGSAGPKLKNNGGTLEIRNAADNAYANVHASEFQAGDGSVAGAVVMNEVAANGTEYRAWQAPVALAASLYLRFPDALPAAGDTLLLGAPSAGVSAMTFGKPVASALSAQYIDWNTSSGGTSIKNKPTLAIVATSGNYADLSNKPAIPSSISCGGVDDDAAFTSAGLTGTAGDYTISGTCLISGKAITVNGVHIHGQPGAMLKHKSADTGNYLLSGNGLTDFSLDGVILDQNGNNQVTAKTAITYFVNGGAGAKIVFKNNVFRNSGTARPQMIASYFESTSFEWSSNTVENTITNYHLYNDSASTATNIRIENNTLDGSNTVAVFTKWGAAGAQLTIAKNHIKNVSAIDPGGECASNDGPCGNGINLYQMAGTKQVVDNEIYNVTFSCVRNAGSDHVSVIGGHCDTFGETGIYHELGAKGNSTIGVTLTNGVTAITNTNIGAAAGSGAIPDIIESNVISGMRATGIYAENAIVRGNQISDAPACIVIGHYNTGYGNLVDGNTCTRTGVHVAVSKDLADAPNSIVGPNVVKEPVNSNVPMLAGFDFSQSVPNIVVTGATKASSMVLTTSHALAPMAGAVYLIGGFYGMTEANGRFCTAGTVTDNTTTYSFACTGLNSTTWGTFAANPASSVYPSLLEVFSSGTTLAYSVPAAVDNKDATNADNIKSGTLAAARIAASITRTIASGALALATASIASGACQTVTTGSVNSAAATGVLTTDTIAFTPNGSIKAVTGYTPGTTGGLTIVPYATAGYVNFDVCNWTSGAITPGAVTLNWRVSR